MLITLLLFASMFTTSNVIVPRIPYSKCLLAAQPRKWKRIEQWQFAQSMRQECSARTTMTPAGGNNKDSKPGDQGISRPQDRTEPGGRSHKRPTRPRRSTINAAAQLRRAPVICWRFDLNQLTVA
jgi:hypothetical protein